VSRRTPGPGGSHDDLGLIVGAIALLALAAASVVWLPVAFVSPPGYTGGGPFTVARSLVDGTIRWTAACTAAAAGEVAALALLGAIAAVGWRRWRRGRTRVDGAARKMASRRDLKHLGPDGVAESARRLRPSLGNGRIDADDTGVLIGHTVAGGMPLRQSWEDVAIDIWGPRTGKTTARAIPAVVAAPGPTLVTSTKGDIVDATRDLRSEAGSVWVFDPQSVIGSGEPSWWWNPLTGIDSPSTARRLAEHFAAADQGPGVTRDAYFDPEGEDLVANLFLAAALGGRTILDAYRWSTAPRDEEPAELLITHGFPDSAKAVHAVLNAPDKQRAGVYGTAKKLLRFLDEPAITRWVTPPAGRGLPQLDPATFVRTTDTLYLLSQGGPGSPAPLVAALTDAVLRAGEAAARTSPGRRLDPPLLSILDEAANICRIRQLPNLYSFYGSHGLPIITILQSYAQGMDVWGRDGMRKLWSAANVRTYGGGVADPDFLDELSKLIGEHDVITRSTSSTGHGWGDRSVSRSPRRQRILDIADLGALPRGRMVVYASGSRPALVKTAPWQAGPHAEQIRASLNRWDPAGDFDPTLDPEPNPGPNPESRR